MKYRIILDRKQVLHVSDEMISLPALKTYFERYTFIGTDIAPEHYDYLFLTARAKRFHDTGIFRQQA